MPNPVERARAILVVVVAPSELSDGVRRDLLECGARGFTTMAVNGYGAHGSRRYGGLVEGNVRFEIVAKPAIASAILDVVAARFADEAVIAYASPVEAVPAAHFT
jgi:nitrogen regulatory protein PII